MNKRIINKFLASKLSKAALLFMFTLSFSILALSSSADDADPDWGYGGAANPSKWGELTPEFEFCELGRDQSPVDVNIVEEGESTEIEFNYQPSEVKVTDNNNSHTIEVGFAPGNTIAINGEEYELLQFHFHTPSEHSIEEEFSAMELHLVHQNQAGELAVIGVMMNEGDENPIIAKVWDAIPQGTKAAKGNTITLDVAELLPEDTTFVSYQGSLTIPPCSEQVSWNLMLEPIELSAEQITTFESIYSYNARPVQPLNGRQIELNPGN